MTELPPGQTWCPFCGKTFEPDVILCLRCGYNLRTGRRARPPRLPEPVPDTPTLPTGASIFVVLLAAAAVSIIWGIRRTVPAGAEHFRSDFQKYVGLKLGEAALSLLGTDGGSGVVFSAAAPKHGPYAALLASLTRELKEHEIEAEMFTPQDLGLGLDDEYADGYERILRRQKPGIIVAVGLGALDIQGAPIALQSFMDASGRLVLLGEITRPESPFLDWVRQGKAIAIVRHTGPLRHLAPAEQTPAQRPTPEQYFEQHYTILTAENIERLIPQGAG